MTAGKTFTLLFAFLHVKSFFALVMEMHMSRVLIEKSAWIVATLEENYLVPLKSNSPLPCLLVLPTGSNIALTYGCNPSSKKWIWDNQQ